MQENCEKNESFLKKNIQMLFGCDRRNRGILCRTIDIEAADRIRRQGTNTTASQAG